jgi:hypothetical protein
VQKYNIFDTEIIDLSIFELEKNIYFCNNYIKDMNKHIHNILGAILGGLFLFASCNSSQPVKSVEEKPELVEYPVGYIAQQITTTLSDSKELYSLQEEFLERFLQVHTQYEGTHPTVVADFPDQWGVIIVERLPEGRELYQIQSMDREWVFLVTTSGFGTHRIIDVLPVALNLANQTEEVLETEIWTAERESDGAFSVVKKYEWIHSLQNVTQQEYDANPQNFLRSKTITDKYVINNSCRFERIETEDVPDYSAVVVYCKSEKPEDWNEIVPMLQALCEDYNVLFVEAHNSFHQLSLYDYKLNYITELDITPYTDLSEGVVFLQKGKTPKAVPYGSYERLQIEMKRYFKIVEV